MCNVTFAMFQIKKKKKRIWSFSPKYVSAMKFIHTIHIDAWLGFGGISVYFFIEQTFIDSVSSMIKNYSWKYSKEMLS